MAANLDPIELLRADFEDDNYETKVAAAKRLKYIAISLGPERTKNDLLPYLNELTEDCENDELLTRIAESLGEFVPLVGGGSEAYTLLPLLERLCAEEETVVRDAAVASISAICEVMSQQEVEDKAFPLLKNLCQADWFTSRVSACGLFKSIYSRCSSDSQHELLGWFTRLAKDDTPMVRKAAYTNIEPFVIQGKVSKELIKEHLLPIVKALSQDHMDSLRCYTVDAVVSIATAFDQQENKELTVPIFVQLQTDSSWKVRDNIVNGTEKMCQVVGKSIASTAIIPGFAHLLLDSETQVKQSCIKCLIGIINTASQDAVISYIGGNLEHFATDDSLKTRILFSKVVPELTVLFGEEPSQKLLVPLLEALVKDEHSEVRNNVISRMNVLADGLGQKTIVNMFIPLLHDLAKDVKWRVRAEVVAQIAPLADHLGQGVFNDKLKPILEGGLMDHVYAIREEAAKQVAHLIKLWGAAWASEAILPSALVLYDRSTNYLHRMTSLLLVEHMIKIDPNPAVLEEHLMSTVSKALGDDVANIRFTAAKLVIAMVPHISKEKVDQSFVPLLNNLQNDEDIDVKYFASEAVKVIADA